MPALPKEVSTACFKRDGWKCRHCENRNGLHPHHVIHQSRGDASTDTLDNLITLCACCHAGHHAGKLDIISMVRTQSNVIVRFIRRKGWRPT